MTQNTMSDVECTVYY